MKFSGLAVALLTGTLYATPLAAQTSPDTPQRLELYSTFISANEMVAALSLFCPKNHPGNYNDTPYGATGALEKLRPLARPDEFTVLDTYVRSDAYAADKLYIHGMVRKSLDNIRTSEAPAAACSTLSATILNNYEAVKGTVQGLR